MESYRKADKIILELEDDFNTLEQKIFHYAEKDRLKEDQYLNLHLSPESLKQLEQIFGLDSIQTQLLLFDFDVPFEMQVKIIEINCCWIYFFFPRILLKKRTHKFHSVFFFSVRKLFSALSNSSVKPAHFRGWI